MLFSPAVGLEKVCSQLEALTKEVAQFALEQRRVGEAVVGVTRCLGSRFFVDHVCATPRDEVAEASGDDEALRDLGHGASPGCRAAASSVASAVSGAASPTKEEARHREADPWGEPPKAKASSRDSWGGVRKLTVARSPCVEDFDELPVRKAESLVQLRMNYLIDKAEALMDAKLGSERPVSSQWRDQVQTHVGREQLNTMLDSVMALVISANAVVLGISCDHAPEWEGWSLIDMCFSFVFMAELALKVLLFGHRGFCASGHNIFDVVVVSLDAVQVCLTLAGMSPGGGEGSLSTSIFRLIRLLRLGRIVRVFRISFFKELLVMINGMMGGMNTLGWSLVLIVLPVYMVALGMRESLGRRSGDDIAAYFSTVPRSMFTIFRCSFGDCSDDSGAPLFEHVAREFGWHFAILYSFFTFVVTIGLFNVISAIFVENVISASLSNELSQKHKRLLDEDLLASNFSVLLQCILAKMDPHARAARLSSYMGEIRHLEVPRDVFNEVICDPHATTALRDLDICKEDHDNLFDILDADKSGGLLFEEILLGLEKLRGDPRRSDIVAVDLMVRSVLTRIDEFGKSLESVQRSAARPVTCQEQATALVGVEDATTSQSSSDFARSYSSGKLVD